MTAKEYYTITREFPTGKGYANLVFIPKTDKPAMIVELKVNDSVESGIEQIKERNYRKGLEKYLDNLLLVSISYDKKSKVHQCKIARFA
ncbi:MAG: PD-(D/E)XK nuclease domain-containing protein [Erysipelotrichaceae bacterium]|nr:PD-(D/E)XK nuclease domain-containing protein [Erysipelotrichaceae bacterium]